HGLLDLKAPDAAGVVAAQMPAGVALVERSLALAALSLAADGEIDGLGRSQLQASDAMLGAGLTRRARRLRVLAAYTLRDPGLLPARPGTGGESRDPTLTAAISLTAAMIAWEEGNARDALRASTPAPLDVAGAPGRLLAAMRVVAAKAALALDDAEAALAATRDGSLDLQEADRSQQPVPPELRPLVARAASSGDLAVELAGLAFRAAIGAGSSVDDATSALLGDVSRALRGWSTLPASWPTTTGALESVIPEDACLVVSTGIGGEDSVALRRDATPHVGARAGISSAGPCATARSVLWLGPARAPGGLTPAPRDERPLVRVVGLAASGAPAGSKGGHRRPERVGPGRPRPFRTLVERLSGELSDSSESPGAARHAGWPVFAGRGVRSSRCPLSSGWLVPSSGLASEGWIGPESIGPYLGDVSGAGEGLVALGLASFGASDPERGAWVLAEAAHEAGRHWSLFSRMPLADEEIEIVERHLPGMAADLPEGLRRLIADAPQLSRKLDLWTLPDRWHSTARRPLGRGDLLLLVGGASVAAVVLTGLLLRTAWRRRRVSAARRRSR
ncbi:MAG: hypothetical protein OEQ13_13350, partial [Acidobacteriota bacterium]|nr:hypothetical protein [Acidobacteriota bacterium]